MDQSFISMNEFHDMLGHPSYQITKATADKMKIKITGKMMRCEHCDVSKMTKKNISKTIRMCR